jgi:gliding motility-associated-like protein
MKNTLRFFFIFFAWLLPLNNLKAQLFLNGDFETNSSPGCQTNLTNFNLNSMLPNCFAFGSGDEIDLQDSTCTYGTAAKNRWFISLSTSIPGTTDAISLELSVELIAGNSYTFSYQDRSNIQFSASQDSLLIGVSDLKNDFGTQIFSSLPDTTQWVKRQVTFTAPFNSKYITLKNASNIRGWNFVDDFEFTCSNSLYLGNDTTLCFGDQIVLSAENPGFNYLWQNNTTDPTLTASEPGIYWVQISTSICSDSDSIQVYFVNCDTIQKIVLEMPNIISPDGNGVNDYFSPIQAEGIEIRSLKVFNRWGQLLYESNRIGQGWDGKYKSQTCTNGTYFWILEYNTFLSETRSAKGYLTLIKP